MSVTVELYGLELYGHHGALDEERARGQRFLFDVEVDVSEAALRSDRLEDAVDYRALAATVRDVSERHAYHLLEALAGAVADELMDRFSVSRVRVRVRKPDVELEAPVEFSAVTVERR